jgi:pilus assembly protein Flp/PilA
METARSYRAVHPINGNSWRTCCQQSGVKLMSKLFSRFLKDESGATAIEYGLIAALISVAIITGATTLGGTLNTTFRNIASHMTAADTQSAKY